MNLLSQDNLTTQLKKPSTILSLWIFTLLLLGITFKNSLYEMVTTWINVEEYGHGFFIPVISVYFLWIRRAELKFVERFKDSLPGLVIVIIGLILFVLGGLATLKIIEQYAFIITVKGMFTVAFGVPGLRVGAI